MIKSPFLKFSIGLLVSFFTLSASYAQDQGQTASKEELIKEIFVLSNFDSVLQQSMQNSCQVSADHFGTQLDTILKDFSKQQPIRITELKERILKRFLNTCLSYTDADSLLQTMTPIYTELLSYEELVALRDLNKMPIFQKMSQLTPVILQRFLEIEQPKMEALYAKIVADIQTEFANIRQEDADTPELL